MKFWLLFFISQVSLAQVIFNFDEKNPEIKFENFSISAVEASNGNSQRYFGEIYNPDGKKSKVGFEKSVPESILRYYSKYNRSIQQKVRVLVKIKNLELTETKSGNNIEGKLNYEIEAFTIVHNDTSRLCRATNNGQYKRTQHNKNIENVKNQVKLAIDGGLSYVVNYIQKFGSQLEAFSVDSEVRIMPFSLKNSVDTVYYQQRKVKWDDFKGPIRSRSGYGAAIFTSFGYDSKIYVENHKIIIEVRPSVYTDKNMSWAKPEIKNDKGLRHEQLHFDISYLNSLYFLQKIKKLKADTRDDLISMIKYEYLEFYRATHNMQEKYDAETDHSLNITQQKQWEQKTAKEIKSIDLKTIINP